MNFRHIVYHENNLEKPFIPQEDYYLSHDAIFVVADGVTHDLVDGTYPNPSPSGNVARIICETIMQELANSTQTLEDLKKAVTIANQNVKKYNEQSSLFLNRESNGFTIGAAVFAVIIIKHGKLIYAVLDDCYFSIFSQDLVDHPTLNSYVDRAAKYYDAHYDWSSANDRKVWRKDFRNNQQNLEGQLLGYGALDGRDGYEQFVQYGEETLHSGDLVCLYTDGFIKIMKDTNLIRRVKDADFTIETLSYISNYTSENKIDKEKTCYFIKYN